MRIPLRTITHAGLILAASPAVALAQTATSSAGTARDAGVSGLWVLANFSYAGMRAQNSGSTGWRIVAFVFGFPGTLLSFLLVKEGGERAYGVDLPRSVPPKHPRRWSTITLSRKGTGAPLGTIDEADLQLLLDRLEAVDEDGTDYFVGPATIEILEEAGASSRLLDILKSAVGGSDGVEITWTKS